MTQNLLIVGLGSIGQVHRKNALNLGARVTTMDCDPAKSAAHLELSEAIESVRQTVSHAVIATPITEHFQNMLQFRAAAILPLRILIEKPLVSAVDYRKLMEDVSQVQTIHTFVGFNWRFNSSILTFKRQIEDGEFGEIQYARLSAREWVPKIANQAWIESGSHILDTARFLLGDLHLYGSNSWQVGEDGWATSANLIANRRQPAAGVDVHVNCANIDKYEYEILVQGSKATGYCYPDREEPMHLWEMQSFLTDQKGLATFEDGMKNLRLLYA